MNLATLERTYTEVDRDAPAPSPFLPGTNIQYAWDSTSLSYLKTCPRLYQYVMIDGWGSRDESIHLRFGQEYHSALEDYDRAKAQGASHEDAIRSSIRDLLARTYGWAPDADSKAGRYKNRNSLLRTVIGYLDHFKDDPAETFILEDGRPAVELSFRFELDWGPKTDQTKLVGHPAVPREEKFIVRNDNAQPYLLSGHLDRVVSFQDGLYVMDRKTTTMALSQHYFAQYAPNNQMTLYSLASQVILHSPVKGVIIDGVQILIEDNPRFQRGFTYRTPDQLSEWEADLRYWFALAEDFAVANYWPMNDTACGNYGGCRFREVCSKSPQVREQFLKAQFDKLEEGERWNPLKPR